MLLTCLFGIGLVIAANPADTLSLSGMWEIRAEYEEQQEVEKTERWIDTTAPSKWTTRELHEAQAVWARKRFVISEKQSKSDAVLRWDSIRWGARVWLNGKEVGYSPLLSPYSILLPKGTLSPGENQLLLKIGGWKGVERSKSGYPLIPSGSAIFRWGAKIGGIVEDIWLEFFRDIRIKHVLMIPEIRQNRVRARIWLESSGEAVNPTKLGISVISGEIEVRATIRRWKDAAGTVDVQTITTHFNSSAEPIEMEIPITEPQFWSLDSPSLYTARFEVKLNGSLCDEQQIRFGMRELAIADGHFQLNGEPFYFRGSNLVHEWLWGDAYIEGDVKGYLIDEAKGMNINAFRTHTLPPPHAWLDIADENGMLILAEFPITFNYRDFAFSPDEGVIFEENAITDSVAWVTKLWNHPSVVCWVPTNESRDDEDSWEGTMLYDAIKGRDPTRPIMRASKRTRDIVDIHCYAGFWRGSEGDFYEVIERQARHRDPRRPLTNSEYIEGFPEPRRLRWTGSTDTGIKAQMVYATFGMEQTESMRRLGYDGIFPYMYAGWTGRGGNWHPDYPTPMYAALSHALAPVAVSIDLFNRNFEAGSALFTQIYLMNDTPEAQKVKLNCYLTTMDAEFLTKPEALTNAIWKDEWDLTLEPDSIRQQTIQVPLPNGERVYYLVAVLHVPDQRPTMSQRTVRVLENTPIPDSLKERKLTVFGRDEVLKTWLESNGIPHTVTLEEDTNLAVIWDAEKISSDTRGRLQSQIRSFVEAGGKLVIFQQGSWDWKGLIDFEIGEGRASRAFKTGDLSHPIWRGVDDEYLQRWNGYRGVIAEGAISGEILKNGQTLLWFGNPKTAAIVSASVGNGSVVISQCVFRERILRDGVTYDPVAERLLINLLNPD